MRNTLVTESDVTSSMMGEVYQQLVVAQQKGKLYKTGYRRAKAAPKEIHGGVTTQASATVTNRSIVPVTGTLGPSIPGTPQLKTPPRPTRVVTTAVRSTVPTHTTGVTTFSSPVPQTPLINISQIQDTTPQTTTLIKKEPSNTLLAAPARKITVATQRRGRPKNQPVTTCQVLDMIEEVNEDLQACPEFDFGKTESEAEDLCEILEDNSELNSEEPMINLGSEQI